MRQEVIGSVLSEKQSADGKRHSGKRTLTLPENLTEIAAWAKHAAEESAKVGVSFNPIDVITRGYSLAHQGQMHRKLSEKYGKAEAKTPRVRDLSGAEAL